uniref:Conserved oligomeric Golgi complex subunit 2 n=1 Tax=Sinocyclocheilus anshuiensis TaxID=1608454 RepID=A0A671QFX3_9TELE
MTLPKGPDSLCFDKDEFMKDDFDVDKFVADCRKRVQLEEMREDLEQYYRLLKTAMVELINKDYADFVNLSTNLVGMDKALNQLSVPLGQLREEVLSLRSSVNAVIEAIDTQLSKQDDIQKKKICVLRLIQVVRSVEKIEKILHQNTKDTPSLETSSPLLAGQILERIATEFNQLQFHAVQSKGMPLLDNVRPRIAGITAMLQQSLEGLLIQGLQTSNIDIVRHCLRTYATIDKTRDAEALVGQVLVKPYMDEVIVEQFVKSNPNGLKMMYSKLLEFVPHHCRLLREVTGGAISSEKADIVPGYDFLVNSVWPEIIRGVEERVPSLFNPGNPDAFYERYTVSMDFVRKFERQCGSQASVKRLRAHPCYQSFHNKWNLPVYFQLRFKEIAGSLENAISDGLEAAPAGSSYHLQVTEVLWSCVCRCWADQVYLPPLAHRFWKLTLQLISRYATFLTEEVPTRASAYMDNALQPLHQLVTDSKNVVKDSIIQEWLRVTLTDCTHRYFETISDVLSSVRKMEESLKRLKQARKTTTTSTVGVNAGPSDDCKIRLQLALDVEYLGEQIQKMGLQPSDITMFSSLLELVQEARDLASGEQTGS